MQYDAFGETLTRSGSTATPVQFAGTSGYHADAATGLLLLGHRYYDASIGRFLSSDPAQAGSNWFAYCDNDPLVRVDPTGHSWVSFVVCVVADAVIETVGGGPEDPIADVGAGEADTAIVGAIDGGGDAAAGGGDSAGGGGASETNPGGNGGRPNPQNGDPYPGTSPRQGIHDPTSPIYNPAKTPLDPEQLPPGVTPEQALRDAWARPVEFDKDDFEFRGRLIGEPGYPLNDSGSTRMDMRVGKNGVHGWPMP